MVIHTDKYLFPLPITPVSEFDFVRRGVSETTTEATNLRHQLAEYPAVSALLQAL